jgi:hypothetical protein
MLGPSLCLARWIKRCEGREDVPPAASEDGTSDRLCLAGPEIKNRHRPPEVAADLPAHRWQSDMLAQVVLTLPFLMSNQYSGK